jgi:hypothetical protein
VIGVLSPFLHVGLISENFSLSRNVPVESILLHMYVRGDTINGLLIFKIFVVISSYPHDFLLYNSLMILPISLVVVFFIAIFVKDCLNAKYNNLTG